jgi:hypothetical protein
MALGVANVAQTALAADGDYIPRATDLAGNSLVVGNVAAAATDSGSPVKVGAKYNSTPPTYTNGQRGDMQIGTRGALLTQLMLPDNSTTVSFAAAADGAANPSVASRFEIINRPSLYNGATVNTWDRVRGNEEITLLASAARTTTQTSADIVNYNGNSALIVVLDMTTVGTASVTVSIDGKDTVSGKYYNILTGAAIITNSTNRYKVGPNIAAVANSIAQDYLPRIFRIVVTANNANSGTYSVGYCLVR